MSAKGCNSLLAATALLLLTAGSALAADRVICVPWEGDPAKPHTAISGSPTQLTCVVKTDSTAQRYYQWVFGDGSTDSTPVALGGKTKYTVEISHTYNAAVGTPFTAQLKVANNSDLVNPVAGMYRLKIEDNQAIYGNNSLDARINIAIDKGLWWLYKNANNGGSTIDGSPFMSWYDNYGVYASPTASAVQAFAINNHKLKADPAKDPYAEAVQLGMNFLMKGRQGLQSAALPDTFGNNNGYGIQTVAAYEYPWNYSYLHQVYEGGQVMDAIIASGAAPEDSTGRDFPGRAKTDANYHEWTYKEVLQDMADMYTYYQHSPNGAWAEWGFNYGEYDNSSSQWAAIGYIPAMAPPWNVVVPSTVKTKLANWLSASYCPSGNTGYMSGAFFGYQGACSSYNDNAYNTTASGMVMMSFADQKGYDDPATPEDERNAKWIGAEKFLADNWGNFMNTNSPSWGGLRSYGYYAVAKAMRLAVPHQVERITKSDGTSFDWYRGDGGANKGLAQRLLETQQGYGTAGGGSWSGELTSQPLATAWMTIILKPALFASSPTACFTANPNPTYSNATVTFDPSCSGHSETGKTIDNLTKFEWDWDNNGTFPTVSTSPALQTHSFYCQNPPCTFPVKLKVTDDSNPALTATSVVDIKITNPPHEPDANAGGPYTVSLCTGDTLTVDGSKSTHPDEGMREAGCAPEVCPGDGIVTYSWDLLAPLTFDTINASSTAPVKTAVVTANPLLQAGTSTIALKVTDNSRLAFPNSGNSTNLSDTAFATLTTKAGCLCTITARAKTGMVQLTWAVSEHTASTKYDIYRSTEGPNTGFTKIRSGYSNNYPVFVDTGLTNGQTYYYRVDRNETTGVCGSKAVSAKPYAL